jgi:AcrR family transcriptional regulator
LRSTIIDAGIVLFSEQGFYGPSIRDIANEAGVALPTLYRIFIDKRDIYENCCRTAFARQGDLMRSVFRPDDPGDVIIFKLTLAGFHLKFHEKIHYRLLNRLFVDHDWDILANEILEFRKSDMILRMAAAVGDAGHETPQLRMMIMEGIFTLGPDLPNTWPTLGIRPDDLMTFTTTVLSIVFPRIDWHAIGEEQGTSFLHDSIASPLLQGTSSG